MPFPAGPGGFQQATEVATPVKFDGDGNVIEAAGWAPGPSVAVPDPMALNPKDAARLEFDRQKQADTNANAAARTAALGGRGGRGGGSSANDRFELRNIGGRVMRVNITTGEKEDMGPSAGEGSGGAGGMTEKGWREGMDQTLSSIQGADAGKLKSIIRQYGGDNQVLIPGANDKETEAGLREMAFAVAETYWNERKPSKSAKSQGEKPGNSAGLLSAPPAAVAELKADPSPEAKRDFDEVFGEGAADRALGRR